MALLVMGADEYGTLHARQLAKAVGRGRLAGPITVVDPDPEAPGFAALAGRPGFQLVRAEPAAGLAAWLAEAEPGDHFIPGPLTPHVLWDWLAASTGRGRGPVPNGWSLPFEAESGGCLYLSAAAWRCPAVCTEPEHCPVLHAPRDWDLAAIIETRADELGLKALVLRCLHLAMGIGGTPVAELRAALDWLRANPAKPALVVTSSHCHAAVGCLLPTSQTR